MDDKARAAKEMQMRASINAKLIETGERDRYLLHNRFFFEFKFLISFYFSNSRLKELLQQKLIECGWRDQVKAHCKGKLLRRRFDYSIIVSILLIPLFF